MSAAKTNNDRLVTAIYDAFMSDMGGLYKANLVDVLDWVRKDLPDIVSGLPDPSASIEKAGVSVERGLYAVASAIERLAQVLDKKDHP